jgi:multidrug efflux pump subunit AcrA (membrane-fusion protein)
MVERNTYHSGRKNLILDPRLNTIVACGTQMHDRYRREGSPGPFQSLTATSRKMNTEIIVHPKLLEYGRVTANRCFFAFAGLMIVGCGQKTVPQATPPPTVLVAKPVKKEIVEWQYFTAQNQAVNTITIIPRVTGYIDSILFKEGDVVNSGDLLYVIDSRPYQAVLQQAKGQLEQALAQQQLNNANLERAKDLLAKKTIAQQDFETTASQKYVADAQVVANQAAVESAQLNLDFTQLRSPIRGRIGRQCRRGKPASARRDHRQAH